MFSTTDPVTVVGLFACSCSAQFPSVRPSVRRETDLYFLLPVVTAGVLLFFWHCLPLMCMFSGQWVKHNHTQHKNPVAFSGVGYQFCRYDRSLTSFAGVVSVSDKDGKNNTWCVGFRSATSGAIEQNGTFAILLLSREAYQQVPLFAVRVMWGSFFSNNSKR